MFDNTNTPESFFEGMKSIYRSRSLKVKDLNEAESLIDYWENEVCKYRSIFISKKILDESFPQKVINLKSRLDLKKAEKDYIIVSDNFAGSKLWLEYVKNNLSKPDLKIIE